MTSEFPTEMLTTRNFTFKIALYNYAEEQWNERIE